MVEKKPSLSLLYIQSSPRSEEDQDAITFKRSVFNKVHTFTLLKLPREP